ncbi:hypothetical protein O1C50_002361 [Vibrio cholerae]|nr:hypothetical protein [Vibrio cholerae]
MSSSEHQEKKRLLEFSQNSIILELLNLQPNLWTGNRVAELYLNKIQGLLPGSYKAPHRKKASYRSAFYSNWSQEDETSTIEKDTNTSSSWWTDFSVALLCQSIDNQNKTVSKRLGSSKINNKVDSCNNHLKGNSFLYYSRILKTFPPITSLLEQLKEDKVNNSKDLFYQAMISNVSVWKIWYSQGLWPNREWELYNNYSKYMALGATPKEVDELIYALQQEELPIPERIEIKNWRNYTEMFAEHPKLDHNEIDAITQSTITATLSYQIPVFMLWNTVNNKNYYSDMFISSGPGSEYRDGKIVCTAMNQHYGFGSFRNIIWLRYAENHLTEYHEIGYHLLFHSLVIFAYSSPSNFKKKVVKQCLEHIARHRTTDIWRELRGQKRDILGRFERTILEPLCYVAGRIATIIRYNTNPALLRNSESTKNRSQNTE